MSTEESLKAQNIRLKNALKLAEQTLLFYERGQHYDTVRVDGDPEGVLRTRILDTGAIASGALKQISEEYRSMKGCEAEVLPKARIMGDITVVEDDDGNTFRYEHGLLIEFDHPEQIRNAMLAGTCCFTFGD